MVHCDAGRHLPRVLHVLAVGRVQGTLEHRARAVAAADPRARQHRDCRLHADPALASAARCPGCRSAAACAMNETAMQAQPEVKRSPWRAWLIEPVFAPLRQGVTPERTALTLGPGERQN